jgi:hypothetical protein
MWELLTGKIAAQIRVCAICHIEFTDYNNIVADQGNFQADESKWRDDRQNNIQAVRWWCNEEKCPIKAITSSD